MVLKLESLRSIDPFSASLQWCEGNDNVYTRCNPNLTRSIFPLDKRALGLVLLREGPHSIRILCHCS